MKSTRVLSHWLWSYHIVWSISGSSVNHSTIYPLLSCLLRCNPEARIMAFVPQPVFEHRLIWYTLIPRNPFRDANKALRRLPTCPLLPLARSRALNHLFFDKEPIHSLGSYVSGSPSCQPKADLVTLHLTRLAASMDDEHSIRR